MAGHSASPTSGPMARHAGALGPASSPRGLQQIGSCWELLQVHQVRPLAQTPLHRCGGALL
eukprot:11710076-Alexandrium_andersonii.AAC.1